MVATIVITLVITLGFIVLLGFVMNDHVVVTREQDIQATPERLFSLIGDFKAWDSWSPWANIDPDAKMEIEGSGAGQVMRWSSSHPKVGNGSQTVLEHEAPRRMVTQLSFGDMGGGKATFSLLDKDAGVTRVVWGMETNMREGVPVLKKPMATFFKFFMDKMVGADYERGLAALKEQAEAAPAQAEVPSPAPAPADEPAASVEEAAEPSTDDTSPQTEGEGKAPA